MTRAVLRAVVLLLVLAGCTSTGDRTDPDRRTDRADASAGAAREGGPRKPRRPRAGQCYRLRFGDAVSSTSDRRPVACRRRHTSVTFLVGELPRAAEGKRWRIGSPRARRHVADRCAGALGTFLGADAEELRLSMLTPVWFTPSPAAAARGARWFRCDAVVLGPSGSLLPLPGRLRDAYDDPAVVRRLAMCGTAAPGTSGFRRVPCGRGHSWRAVRSVDLPGDTYPDTERVTELMEGPCADTARTEARDPLEVTWAQEGPTRERWRAGQRYGLCWVPVT